MSKDLPDLTSIVVLQPLTTDEKERLFYSKLNAELKNFVTTVSNSQCDWKLRYDSMGNLIKFLAQGNAFEGFVVNLAKLISDTSFVTALEYLISDLRSEIVRQCARLLALIAELSEAAGVRFAINLLTTLVAASSSTNKVIRGYAQSALITILIHCGSRTMLSHICGEYKQSKSKATKELCSQLLLIALYSWSDFSRRFRPSLELLFSTTYDMIMGLNPEIRENGARSFWFLCAHFPDNEQRFTQRLDNKSLKLVSRYQHTYADCVRQWEGSGVVLTPRAHADMIAVNIMPPPPPQHTSTPSCPSRHIPRTPSRTELRPTSSTGDVTPASPVPALSTTAQPCDDEYGEASFTADTEDGVSPLALGEEDTLTPLRCLDHAPLSPSAPSAWEGDDELPHVTPVIIIPPSPSVSATSTQSTPAHALAHSHDRLFTSLAAQAAVPPTPMFRPQRLASARNTPMRAHRSADGPDPAVAAISFEDADETDEVAGSTPSMSRQPSTASVRAHSPSSSQHSALSSSVSTRATASLVATSTEEDDLLYRRLRAFPKPGHRQSVGSAKVSTQALMPKAKPVAKPTTLAPSAKPRASVGNPMVPLVTPRGTPSPALGAPFPRAAMQRQASHSAMHIPPMPTGEAPPRRRSLTASSFPPSPSPASHSTPTLVTRTRAKAPATPIPVPLTPRVHTPVASHSRPPAATPSTHTSARRLAPRAPPTSALLPVEASNTPPLPSEPSFIQSSGMDGSLPVPDDDGAVNDWHLYAISASAMYIETLSNLLDREHESTYLQELLTAVDDQLQCLTKLRERVVFTMHDRSLCDSMEQMSLVESSIHEEMSVDQDEFLNNNSNF